MTHEKAGYAMNRVKQLRKAQGFSQQELANLLGVHQTAVSQWEKGRTTPSFHQAWQLAEVFNTNVEYVMGYEEEGTAKIDYKALGAEIRRIRKAAGLSQLELGKAISQTGSNIARYEQGLRKIPLNILATIASVLKVDYTNLLKTACPEMSDLSTKSEPSTRNQVIQSAAKEIAEVLVKNGISYSEVSPVFKEAEQYLTLALVPDRDCGYDQGGQ